MLDLRSLGAVVVAVVMTVTTAACSAGRGPHELELVVPFGTTERLARGEDVEVMPAELRFEVGDTLRIRNEDAVDQSVGPYRVGAGEEFELTFGSPGRFEGVCPLADGDRYLIVVTG